MLPASNRQCGAIPLSVRWFGKTRCGVGVAGFPKGAIEMKRLLATAAIALSVTTAVQAANNTTMFASSYWRVTHMARNYDGKPMCIMSSQISFTNGTTAYVQIKWVKGRSNPFIELDKTNWQFPPDLQVLFSIKLDNGQHEFVGVSKTDPKGGYERPPHVPDGGRQ